MFHATFLSLIISLSYLFFFKKEIKNKVKLYIPGGVGRCSALFVCVGERGLTSL